MPRTLLLSSLFPCIFYAKVPSNTSGALSSALEHNSVLSASNRWPIGKKEGDVLLSNLRG